MISLEDANITYNVNKSGTDYYDGYFDEYDYERFPSDEVYMALMNQCNNTVLSVPFSPKEGEVYCNATFDSWGCWNYTKAGTRTYIKCPGFLSERYGNPPPGTKAFKDCTENGTWWTHPETGQPWSNYSLCTAVDNTDIIYTSGHSVSIILLAVAFAIFTRYSQLHCKRVTLHKNMFASYLLQASFMLGLDATLRHPTIPLTNPYWCQALHVMTWYFRETNYAWMFAEGFFLHTQIAVAFTNDKKLMKFCLFIGWVIPLIATLLYAILRGVDPSLTTECWSVTDKSSYVMWILRGPILCFLLVNLIFLVNIMRILLSKLRASRTSDTSQSRSALRAALMLVPLLGMQYFVVLFVPDKTSVAHSTFVQLSAVLSSYQGASVAILFCFLNKEVINLFRRRLSQMRDTYWPSTSSGTRSTLLSRSVIASGKHGIAHSIYHAKKDEVL